MATDEIVECRKRDVEQKKRKDEEERRSFHAE
jgi:hypothetical protein